MSLQFPLSGVVSNDLVYEFDLTVSRMLLDLTPYTIRVILKASANIADSTGTTYEVGSGLTITNASAGAFTWDIPRADVGTPGAVWYRADVIDSSSNVATAMYGPLTLIAA
jgi:hypothetical protein